MNAQDRRVRWYACWRKQTHVTWQNAQRALRSLQKRAEPGLRFQSYRCQFCTAFHVGRVPDWSPV